MSRSKGERERLRHSLDHLRAVADSVDTALGLGGPFGPDLSQSVELVASNVSRGLTKHDAFLLVEEDFARNAR